MKPVHIQDARRRMFVGAIFFASFLLLFAWLTLINLNNPHQYQTNLVYVADSVTAFLTGLAVALGLLERRLEYYPDHLFISEGLIRARREKIDYSNLEIEPLAYYQGAVAQFKMRAKLDHERLASAISPLGSHSWTMTNYRLRNSDTSIYSWLIGAGARQTERQGIARFPRQWANRARLLIMFGLVIVIGFGAFYMIAFGVLTGFVIVAGGMLFLILASRKFSRGLGNAN